MKPVEYIYFTGLLAGLFGFSWSSFLVSVCAGLMLVYCFIEYKEWLKPSKNFSLTTLFGLVLLGWALLDGFRSENLTIWNKELMLLLGFVAITGATYLFFKENKGIEKRRVVFLVYILHVLLASTGSVIRYLNNKVHYDSLLAHGKHIPIIGGMNHIQFGLFSALAVCIAIYYAMDCKKAQKTYWWTILLVGILLFVNMHVLSSRTGLLAVYIALFVGALFFGIKTKKWLNLFVLLLVIILSPIVLWFGSSSFRNKLKNTSEDWNATSMHEDINDQSFAQRVESWKVAWYLVKKEPLLGYGVSNTKTIMQKGYIETNSVLRKENRIHVHNQWLQFGLEGGVLKMVVFSLFLLVSLIKYRKNALFISFLSMVCIASILSAYFGRQMDLFFIGFFFPFLSSLNYFNTHQST